MLHEVRLFLAAVTLSAVLVSGCESGGPETTGFLPESTPELRVGESPAFSIEDPGDGEPPFHEIASIVFLANGNVAIADQAQRIVVVDAEGAPIRSFGGSGDGPGEFRDVAWIQQVHEDSLVAYDPLLGRASVFSIHGEYARTITPEPRPGSERPPRLLGVFEDGDLLASEQLLAPPPDGGSGIVRADMIVSRHDSDGVFLDSLTGLPADERVIAEGVLVSVPFLRATSVAMDGNRFHVATGEHFEVATYDRDGALVRTVREDVEPRPVNEELLESVEVAEPLIPMLPTRMPAVSDIISDPLGRLWVGSHVLELEEEDVSWRVFDSGGDLLHDVAMPDGFRPLDIGESWIVGIWTDALGVEYVRLYPLVESGG